MKDYHKEAIERGICPLCGRTKHRPWDACICRMLRSDKYYSQDVVSASKNYIPPVVQGPLSPRELNQLTQARAEVKYLERKLQEHIDASIKKRKRDTF